MRISGWSSDVCSSDLPPATTPGVGNAGDPALITDMPAVGKTPTMLQQDLKLALSQYIKDPIVSVIVTSFNSTFSQQVRVVGATEKPASIPFRATMTVLDAMIAVGGLGEYAAGNKARSEERRVGKEGVRTCRYRW